MEQSPFWEANRISASEDILLILWNPKVHYRIRKSPPPVSILSQINPVHPIPLFNIHFHFSTACVVKKKSVRVPGKWSLTSQIFAVRQCSHFPQPPSWMFIPCRLSCISEGLSSIRNMRTPNAVLTWTNLSRRTNADGCYQHTDHACVCSFSYWTRGLTSTTLTVRYWNALLMIRTVRMRPQSAAADRVLCGRTLNQ